MIITPELLTMLFCVAVLASFIDSVSGGGGLIALPTLMLAGLSPVQAIGTNKFQAIFGKISSVRYFLKHGLIDVKKFKLAIVVTFICAGLGGYAVQLIPNQDLVLYIPWMIGLVALYTIFSPRMADIDTSQRLTIATFSFIVVPFLAFYDGFFGPAASSFFSISFIALLGFSTAKAVAHTKLLLLFANGAAIITFIIGGHIIWEIGFIMAIGQWIGGHYGSKMVHLKGSKIVKPMLISVCFILIGKMIYQSGVVV